MFRKIIKGLKDVWCGTLEFDTEPKKGSLNPVTSDGVYESINGASGAKEIVYFDVDPSDPPSGIYAAITEALSNNKEPVIRDDGTVYFYSSTGTDKYVFVGGYDTGVVKYTTVTVSENDSVVKETVDTIEGMVFPLYYHSEGQGFTVADKTGHALTKTEIADAYRAGQIFMFSSYPASNTQAHWGYCCDIDIDSDNTGYAEFFILSAYGGDSYSWEKYRINLSSNTEFVTLWGPNTSYSRGYSGSYANASDVAALQSQVSSLSDVSAYSVKGEATVAQLNAGPSGIQAGWAYQLTDSGTLTAGSLAVVAGDTVAWDGTKWFPLVKSDYYATKTYAQNVAKSVSDISETTKNIIPVTVVQKTSVHGLTYSVGEKNFVDISGTTDSATVNIDLALRERKTLAVGNYCVSLQGKFVRGGASIVAYLLDSSNNAICYGTFNADGYATLSVASESVVYKVKLRFNGSGSAPDIEGNMQLEKGNTPTKFEGVLSAVDYKSRNDIDLLQRTANNKVTPIFNSGSITSNGEPVYSNTDSSREWIVTPKIYKVKKGSYIKYIGNKNIYLNVSKFSNGQFVSYSSASGFNGKFIFNEDTEIRIAMRFVDYSAILPEDAASNLQFEFYSNDEQKTDLEMYFLGIGSGLGRNSGYAILAKLPNGKNLLIDSHLMSYAADLTVYLRNAGVRKIDYYVQTHYHEDHIGILNVLQNYPTRIDIKDSTAFLPPVVTLENLSQVGADAQTFVDRQDALEAYLAANDCTVIRPDSTTDYDLGGGVKLRFYNTDHSIYSDPNSGYYSKNYNDWSICPQLIFGMNVVNLSSDIGPTGERKVAGTLLKANILTAPHHGWDNGVNNLVPAFINNVSPDCVISVNGREHHPDNTGSGACVMKATSAMQSYCEANAVPNYLTCLNGQIKVIMNENTWKFDGTYSRYIRNGKNWSYTDNSEHVES